MANIVLGVTGGIAAYKAVNLLRLYTKGGHSVKVVMTDAACEFVGKLTFETLSGSPVLINEFREGDPLSHINLGKWADMIVIAPATANTIAKVACGIADNLLTATILASSKPVVICPAMNGNMYLNHATQANIRLLCERGVHFIDPSTGLLACGDYSAGKLAEPEEIFEQSLKFIHRCEDAKGVRFLITAGPTVENIDPVRYISNYSSGKMGYSIAKEADALGGDVTLISGPTCLEQPVNKTFQIRSAEDMLGRVNEFAGSSDIVIMSAAVADYRPEKAEPQKIKKHSEKLSLSLVKNVDILKTTSLRKTANQVFVGFAAESEDLKSNALKKLKEKKLDMIVANDISRKDIGFGSDNNEAVIFFQSGEILEIKKQSKSSVARIILENALAVWRGKN